jgi:hypothetical protein
MAKTPAADSTGSYYKDEGPEIPVPPGYSAPTPHDAKVSQRPFEAPSSMPTGNPRPHAHGAWDYAGMGIPGETETQL